MTSPEINTRSSPDKNTAAVRQATRCEGDDEMSPGINTAAVRQAPHAAKETT